MSDERAAWTGYWRGTASGTACLPGAPPAVQDALAATWTSLAEALPDGARVLDIATGNGAVLRSMAGVRPDLRLTGIDYAELPAVDGLDLRGGVDATELPFPDAAFAAVTSQFGIEYAAPAALREAARMVAPGGMLRLIVHHADSQAVVHNRARLAAMRALDEAGLFAFGRRVAAGLGSDPATARAIEAARATHRAQSIATELPAAVIQAVRQPGAVAPIEAKARDEMARLAAMLAAARDHAAIIAMTEAVAPDAVASPLIVEAHPIAWRIDFTRR